MMILLLQGAVLFATYNYIICFQRGTNKRSEFVTHAYVLGMERNNTIIASLLRSVVLIIYGFISWHAFSSSLAGHN